MTDTPQADALMGHINVIMRSMLVAARNGAPAEGRLPFNPLYFNMLRVIGATGSVRPSSVAAALQVSRTTISTAARALQSRGLVQSEPDASDGRASLLRLTPDGQDTLEAILRQDHRNAAAMLQTLDPEQRAGFVALMGQVADGLQRD